MRKTFEKLIIGACIAAVAVLGADNSIGTWKLNLEKSKFEPSVPVKSLTSVREASDGGVKVTNTGERANGDTINASYTAKYDGKWVPVTGTGSPYDSIAIQQKNANSFTSTAKKAASNYKSEAHIEISKDGKTMTSTSIGTDAEGKEFHYSFVYEKQ